MKDELLLTDIVVHKVDSTTGKPITGSDFIFAIYKDEGCTDLISIKMPTKKMVLFVLKTFHLVFII